MKPRVWYHCYMVGPPDSCAGGWRHLFWDACIKMEASGLSEAADCNLVLVGPESERRWLTEPTTEPQPWLHRVPWLKLDSQYGPETNACWFENITLQRIWEDCTAHHADPDAEAFPVLYHHTKGCLTENFCVHLWREYMQAFLVEDWRNCVEALMGGWGFNTCGVEFKPFGGEHYSGNFWWARSDYIASLRSPRDFMELWPGEPRMSAEYWVTHKPGGSHCKLFDSGHDDLYRNPVRRKDYRHALGDPLQ